MSDTFDTDGQDEGNSNEYKFEDLSADQKTAVTAIRQIADLPEELPDIDKACDALRMSWIRFTELKAAFKAEEKRHKERCMTLCEAHGIKSIELCGDIKLTYKEVKKDVFDSEKIKEALKFTPEQLAVLPKNPAWKKSVIVSIPETCEFYKQDTVMDIVQDKPKVKKELKEFNPAFVK